MSGLKLRYAERALETVFTKGMIQQPADVTASWLTNETVGLQIGLVAADKRVELAKSATDDALRRRVGPVSSACICG
jgi:hypothetical protein